MRNIVEMLVNPTGAKHTMDIWDQQASQFLVALILHVLYAEPDQFKNLATVRRGCSTSSGRPWRWSAPRTASTHRTGAPEVHPEVALVANELRRQPAKFQSSVCGTAAAYLTLWADADWSQSGRENLPMTRTRRFHRGRGDGMHAKDSDINTGSPPR